MILIIMGVCGCGKTTVGEELAKQLKWRFTDGDEFHTDSNKRKMSQGEPLTDQDRYPWLINIHKHIKRLQNSAISSVITCSALKMSYRTILATGETPADCLIGRTVEPGTTHARCTPLNRETENPNSTVSHNSKEPSHDMQNRPHDMQIRSAELTASHPIIFVHLTGSEAVLRWRMCRREGHFMPESLLTSQLMTLEIPNPEERCVTVDVDNTVPNIVSEIISKLGLL